ncbi:hypothetical protein CerSpe_001880 [Prunus speciosa]
MSLVSTINRLIKASYLLVFLSTLFLAASVSSTFGYKQHQHGGREREEEERDNPFYFPSQMFQSRFKSDEGGFYVLEKFTKRRQSEAIRGVENYRLAIFEAKPSTLILFFHTTVMLKQFTLFSMGSCRGYNLFINEDNDETLRIAKLLQPVNSPSRFEEFFPSVFSAMTFLNGIVMRASKEQLKALSEQGPSASRKAIGSKSIINLPTQKPVHSNNYGKFYEARPGDFNGKFSYIEINQEEAIMMPHYNSKSIYLMMVVEGRGRYEMAGTCPHLRSQGQEESMDQVQEIQQYRKFSADLSPGNVFVIPAAHPAAIVAQNNNNNNGNQNQNLRLVGFGINAQNNMRNFLPGQENNIMKEMEREAKQLAFGQEMEQIFSKQKQSYFVPIQQSRLASALDF